MYKKLTYLGMDPIMFGRSWYSAKILAKTDIDDNWAGQVMAAGGAVD